MRNGDCTFLTQDPQAVTDTRPNAGVNEVRAVKAVLGLRQARLHVLSVGADAERIGVGITEPDPGRASRAFT